MIGRIHHPRAQYLDPIFPWYVFRSWNYGIRNTDIQNLYQVQRDKTTRNAYQFLNLTLNLLAHRLYILYGSPASRSGDPDRFLGTRIYVSAYES